jgi:TrkA domain protein
VFTTHEEAPMRDITEVQLPGVGVRFEFTAGRGQRVAVVSYRSGRHELALYDQSDPDTCRTVVDLDAEDATTLASILGAPQVAEAAIAMQRIEGLALDWLTVQEGSDGAGSTIAEGQYRARTGASIVAVIRQQQTYPAPEPEFALAAGDVAVAVGTPDGLKHLRSLLAT